MKPITKLQKGNIVHLADGRSARVVQTYFGKPLTHKIMAEIVGKDYSKTNIKADMVFTVQIKKVTS